jgi:putative ABC transport system permease protein
MREGQVSNSFRAGASSTEVGSDQGQTCVGIGVGVAATFGVGRVMRGMLYGVEPHDPPTIAVIAVGLAAAALVACCLPAAKAARVDPVIALRQE